MPDRSITRATYLPEISSDPVHAIRSGLAYAAFENLKQRVGLSATVLAPALGISTRTLKRREQEGKLTTPESDRLAVLAEVFAIAVRALDSEEKARMWLKTPHPLLNDETPLAHMDTVAGSQQVKDVLLSIEYGMPA